MSEHHVQAREVYKAEEVFDVVFPSGNETAEVAHPGEEPLCFPALSIAVQLATVFALTRKLAEASCSRI